MAVVPIKIPQLGEGLQEARLIEFLKQPGDRVERDECIYVMETDKAISEIEATEAGTVVEWLIEPDTVVEIGAEIELVIHMVMLVQPRRRQLTSKQPQRQQPVRWCRLGLGST